MHSWRRFKTCQLARMSDGHYCPLRSLGQVKGGNGMKHHEVVIDFSRRGVVEFFPAMPLVPVDAIRAASAKASTSARSEQPKAPGHPCLSCQQHAHHRDLLVRAAAETQAHGNSTKDQHRHLVTELMLDRYKYAQCLCWHPADNAVAFVMTATLPFG